MCVLIQVAINYIFINKLYADLSTVVFLTTATLHVYQIISSFPLFSFSFFYGHLFSLQMSKFHYSQVRVKFEDEDGSGPGVNRGFFASLANAIRQSDSVSTTII